MTLVVTEDGNMSVFGYNHFGQLGLGHWDQSMHPTLLDKRAFGGKDVVMASAGFNHSACVTSTGSLWIWVLAPMEHWESHQVTIQQSHCHSWYQHKYFHNPLFSWWRAGEISR